jgi:hypothetical protein
MPGHLSLEKLATFTRPKAGLMSGKVKIFRMSTENINSNF